MPYFRAASAAAAIVLVGALSGCGGDDEDTADLGGSWEATLNVLPDWSETYRLGAGTAEVMAGDGTTVRLAVAGLGENLEYTAHVHDAACDADPPGGDHWMAGPNAEEATANEIALSLTTTEDGTGSTEISSELVVDDRAKSVVVHAPEAVVEAAGLASDRVLCGDLLAQ